MKALHFYKLDFLSLTKMKSPVTIASLELCTAKKTQAVHLLSLLMNLGCQNIHGNRFSSLQ